MSITLKGKKESGLLYHIKTLTVLNLMSLLLLMLNIDVIRVNE